MNHGRGRVMPWLCCICCHLFGHYMTCTASAGLLPHSQKCSVLVWWKTMLEIQVWSWLPNPLHIRPFPQWYSIKVTQNFKWPPGKISLTQWEGDRPLSNIFLNTVSPLFFPSEEKRCDLFQYWPISFAPVLNKRVKMSWIYNAVHPVTDCVWILRAVSAYILQNRGKLKRQGREITKGTDRFKKIQR